MTKMNLRTFLERYNNGDFDNSDHSTQCLAGWYDWFCKDASLARRLQPLAKALMLIRKSSKIDLDSMYAYFKNCCPLSGPTYDRIGISTLDGTIKYVIEYGDKRNAGTWVVWDMETTEPGGIQAYTGNITGMAKWFMK